MKLDMDPTLVELMKLVIYKKIEVFFQGKVESFVTKAAMCSKY